ncbi:MAG TPA: hypothetical protein VJN18_35710 [Polyangiaceae bacterium]|nr:hypothetical protein [Polyangiaceae bacterium]
MHRKTTTTFFLRVVEEHFSDDEPPSLTGIPVVETTGETIPEQPCPLAKCRPERARKAVGS